MIISPTLHTAGLAAAESLINQLLRLDPAGLHQLAALDSHVFHLQCTDPALDVYVIPQLDGIRLCGIFDGPPDTTLSGSAAELFKLAAADDPANALINGKLNLQGNSQALIELQKILNGLDLDWEAPLASLFGDVLGHQIGRSLRGGQRFFRDALRSAKRQFDDYLHFESDLLPAHWQLEQFYQDVDQLHQRSERLQARITRLAAQLTPTTVQP